MSKRHRRAHFSAPATSTTTPSPTTAAAAPAGVEVFSFGDPEAVLDKREILDYLECPLVGKWYEPPISFDGLAKSSRSAVHHYAPMVVKRNILVSTFIPHRLLSGAAFSRLVMDFQVFGNAYLEQRNAVSGRPLELVPSLARYTRRGRDLDSFFFIGTPGLEYEFPRGRVFHLLEPDLNQEVYGLPEYIPALHSAWLNESATLFRRRYYKNGSHAGFILYMTDAAQQQADVDNLREALKNAKGPGNFRNLFMYAPNGKKDGIQIIPVAEVAAKDEFINIKNTTRDDMLAMHRMPPQLMGVVPNNTGGFGDAGKAAAILYANEIKPMQARLAEINNWVGEEVIRFGPYELAAGGTGG